MEYTGLLSQHCWGNRNRGIVPPSSQLSIYTHLASTSPSTFTKWVGISSTRRVYATPPNIGPTLKLQYSWTTVVGQTLAPQLRTNGGFWPVIVEVRPMISCFALGVSYWVRYPRESMCIVNEELWFWVFELYFRNAMMTFDITCKPIKDFDFVR